MPRRRIIKTHTYEPTTDKNIFRFVNREGNWTHYFIKNKKIFVPAVNHIIRAGYPKGERFYQYLLNSNPIEAERRLRTSSEAGARTHEAIRSLLEGRTVTIDTRFYNELTEKSEPLSAEEWENLASFTRWCARYKPQILFQETTIWSETFSFAGTLDFLGTIKVPKDDKGFALDLRGKRIMILLDWKTSSAIWDEYELQTAAYRKALQEYMPDLLASVKQTDLYTGIVRLGTAHKEGFEIKTWNPEESESNFALFASAYAIFVRKYGVEFTPEDIEIPSEFKVKVPQIKSVNKTEKHQRGTGTFRRF